MLWEKKGLIYCANKDSDWKYQWCILPTPILLNEDIIRVFIGFCDKNTVGRIGYIDLDSRNPSKVLAISKDPVLDIGTDGSFDDNGVVPISVLFNNSKLFLYYIGFQKGVKIPYYMFCGLALGSKDLKEFRRYSKVPILDRTDDELFARCGVNVIFDTDDNLYKMWYIGSYKSGWTQSSGKLKPLYVMKYTYSEDGINWKNRSTQCMEFLNNDEHGFGRPFVWKESGIFKMYFCVRTYSRGYYISYAESCDGIKWERRQDKCGIDLSDDGWDSENMCYPFLLRTKYETFMFYNGNGCGKTGFGYAKLVED